ncbi:methyl-accepting chemotaxis protein [Salirhabdus sp. Marseille-P4669]|uniref:methyl-accepting chemotaxis protein n=1 Tax=Salirhabdus sp. Marseille-P4669 TaxID=2042310 RepID=UPI000C7BC0E9|nr:methyl-accepting chemotaxis protein [Salirhabdus sp. Marseille-P4669]
MKKLFNYKSIKTKILVGFSALIVLTILLSAYNYYSIYKIDGAMKDLISEELELLTTDKNLAQNMAQRTSLLRGYMLYGDESYREQFEAETESSISLENKALELSKSEKLNELIEKKIQWGTFTDEIFAEIDKGNMAKAESILKNEVQQLEVDLVSGFNELASEREVTMKELGLQVVENGESMQFYSVIITALVAVLGIAIAIITSNFIANPIRTVMGRMKRISTGDLSGERFDTIQKDESGQLMHATNEMVDHIRNLLIEINKESNNVTAHSEELNQSANEVKVGTEQITITMEELASGSESQANQTGELSSVMAGYTEKVEEANVFGEQIQEQSNEVITLTNDGTELMNASMTQMKRIDDVFQNAVQKVKTLDEQSQQISKLVYVIRDISDQTNLLALNAAIEAARAGEHGKGFAVVADEVRKLAEQVGHSVEDITKIVTNIQNEFDLVTENLESGYQDVEKGTNQIEMTGEKFHNIRASVNEMVTSINTITTNLSEITANTQQMSSSVQEIAAISEESAAGIEQTSASAQQTSSSIDEVASSADDLAKLAENLTSLVQRFTL